VIAIVRRAMTIPDANRDELHGLQHLNEPNII
jgi:hypothetical protein